MVKYIKMIFFFSHKLNFNVRNRSDLEKHFMKKLNAKRFLKNILKNSKNGRCFGVTLHHYQVTFRHYSMPLSSQDGKSFLYFYCFTFYIFLLLLPSVFRILKNLLAFNFSIKKLNFLNHSGSF